MPKIRWKDLPAALREHLFERLREGKISAEDLFELELWRESEAEAPQGRRVQGLRLLQGLWREAVSEDLPPPGPACTGPQAVVVVEASEGSMSRKKRNLFRELLAGISAMRDHAEGKIELRTALVTASGEAPENAPCRRRPSRLQRPNRGR